MPASPIQDYYLRLFNSAGAPLTVPGPFGPQVHDHRLGQTDMQVGQDPLPPAPSPVVNPTVYEWDDPNRVGKKIQAIISVWQINVNGALWVPNGTGYTAKLIARSAVGDSLSAATGAFDIDRPTPPAPPANFAVHP